MLNLEKVVKDNISRVVAFVLAPLLLLITPPLVNAINEVLGTGFTDRQISDVAIATVVGIALALYKWLANRGRFEIAAVEKAANKVYSEGRDNVKSHGSTLHNPNG